ncbi:MAG: 4-hydroxythreonine-4-phosphate dehydrogenase PdxA [Candidatus Sumerlaeaceae bacterium]|nr:4-hydroxythreonine-4-phosphate dehydrogenase PdxA [Candidatus Sumerlaeaceae bacterium]
MNHSINHKPTVAITVGDPGGIGFEVVVRACADRAVQNACRPIVVGDFAALQRTAASLQCPVRFAAAIEGGLAWENGTIPVVETGPGGGSHFKTGVVSATNGRAAHEWIVRGAKLVQDGDADALVTAPISKEAMFAAGFQFPGHTELLAELCGGANVRMMLEGGGLHVVLETIHVALKDVPRRLSQSRLLATLRITNDWGQQFLTAEPRIAVAGLNPHAGENGHFGREEIDVISPAVHEAQRVGLKVSGPYAADTVFHRALEGEFDMVLAMYHDQALIPVKTLDFHRGVNITLGLPIIRTSPDHGTAFEIAGKGVAKGTSMISATLRAAELARKKAGVLVE